nr:stress response protein NST1-like [Labrus bergylta]
MIYASYNNSLLQVVKTPKQCCCSFISEPSPTKDVGWKLREALKQQLAIIHERVEAKKLAKLALAEVREILAKEAEEKELELGRKDISSKVKERVAARLKEEEEKMEKEEMEKLKKEKTNQVDDKKKDVSKVGDKKPMKVGEKEEKLEGEGKKAIKEDGEKGSESTKEKRKKSKEKSEGVKKK